ncbi:thioredoxin family protein [Nitratifractor salsuginis]|uniref:Uncharacterized protein n=1 Tax=Nitratifractor salsuginis (strain DSM 16511 / JCM 12458 / E9I37-1) TaxID=749222 RepID=E6X0F6_NITSE|nr:thioredoxin family protein [Nitratifractor salsuginis]ADV46806.1 hypothetical protein Nitsa_1558 [Nitratifractor salsuginis DSM 16511]
MDRPLILRRFLFLLLTVVPLWARISWMGDYAAAHRLALRQHKDLLVVLVKRGCRECGELIRRIGVDEPLRQSIEKRYIPVIITADSGARYPIELYYTTRFPTIFFVDAAKETFLAPSCYGMGCIKRNITTIPTRL